MWVLIRHLQYMLGWDHGSLCEMEREGHKQSVCVTVMMLSLIITIWCGGNTGVERQTAQSFAI